MTKEQKKSAARRQSGPGKREKSLIPPPDAWPAWDGSPLPVCEGLRWGFSTGACAAAVLTASFIAQTTGTPSGTVPILFADGAVRTLPLISDGPEREGMSLSSPASGPDATTFMAIRKNGGDDPDATHGLVVLGRIRRIPGFREAPRGQPYGCGTGRLCEPGSSCGIAPSEAGENSSGSGFLPPACPYDITLPVGGALVTLHALTGIGIATRAGLDARQGRWSITPGPLGLIAKNLARAGLAEGRWYAELAVPGGREAARKTLNGQLGVTGGISLLGTTGLVRPYSHEAYIATIRTCVNGAAREGDGTVVFCTGGRTQAAARAWTTKHLSFSLSEHDFISIADFIGESLRAAANAAMKRAIVCCMPGKLLKYAAGLDNTHAHRTEQDIPKFAARLRGLFRDDPAIPDLPVLADAVTRARSMREALAILPARLHAPLLAALADEALASLAKLVPTGTAAPHLAILLAATDGTILSFYPGPGFASIPGSASCPHAGETPCHGNADARKATIDSVPPPHP